MARHNTKKYMHSGQNPDSVPKSKFRKLIDLVFGFSLLFIFAFVIVPAIASFPGFNKLIEHNKKNGIEAGSLFYSETPSFGEADNFFKNCNKRSQSTRK